MGIVIRIISGSIPKPNFTATTVTIPPAPPVLLDSINQAMDDSNNVTMLDSNG